jgi:RNA polymerase sigma-70 factor (ECF subfamily)
MLSCGASPLKVAHGPEQAPGSMTDRLSPTELLQRVASVADRQAFAQLYRSFAPRIRAFLLRWGASVAQADDVTQDAMLTVWRKAERFDRRRAGSSTWVFTIVRNRFVDVVRKQGRPKPDPTDPAFVADPSEAQHDRWHDRQALLTALATLPTEQAASLESIYLQGKTYAQVAEEIGVPLSTVKTRVRLGLRRLREHEALEVGS